MGSDSFCDAGSAGDSPRPSLDTTFVTPGTAAISFAASISSLIDSSIEIDGTRMITGVTAPSRMIGMNDLPNNGYKPTASKREATDTSAVAFGFLNAK